jgi:hypothetical protein
MFGITPEFETDIWTPDNDEEIVYEWDDDPYLGQIEAFVSDVGYGTKRVLSTFEDAIQTYEFTWGIREASEKRWNRLRAFMELS